MATGPTIDYAKLQQEAMRGVVRAVLHQIVKTGLPGEHHFYVSFLTQAPGVILSKRLKEKYPSEMTIVLQHRFWDLIERLGVTILHDDVADAVVVVGVAVRDEDRQQRLAQRVELGAQCLRVGDRECTVDLDDSVVAFDQICIHRQALFARGDLMNLGWARECARCGDDREGGCREEGA